MSSGCGDVLSLEDLKTAKKHQIFEAEVITGKAGGVSGGSDIDYATNQVTGQTQKTLPAILSSLGFVVADFNFVSGGTLASGDENKIVLWPSPEGDGQYYHWTGAYPKVVPAASTPTTGWKLIDGSALRIDLSEFGGAAMVGYSYNGSLSTTKRTVANKLDDTVSLWDFHCDSSGDVIQPGPNVDSRQYLQAAIDYMNANGGGTLLIPESTWYLNSISTGAVAGHNGIIQLKSNVNIKLDGTIKVGSALASSPFQVFVGFDNGDPASSGNLENCHIYGNGILDFGSYEFGSASQLRNGIAFGRSYNCSVTGITFQNGDVTWAITLGWNGYGSSCYVRKCRFIDLVNSSVNADHSTVYVNCPYSGVESCYFSMSSSFARNIACSVELHQHDTFYRRSTVNGYCRGAYVVMHAAEAEGAGAYAYNMLVESNIAVIYGQFVILGSDISGTISGHLSDVVIAGNVVSIGERAAFSAPFGAFIDIGPDNSGASDVQDIHRILVTGNSFYAPANITDSAAITVHAKLNGCTFTANNFDCRYMIYNPPGTTNPVVNNLVWGNSNVIGGTHANQRTSANLFEMNFASLTNCSIDIKLDSEDLSMYSIILFPASCQVLYSRITVDAAYTKSMPRTAVFEGSQQTGANNYIQYPDTVSLTSYSVTGAVPFFSDVGYEWVTSAYLLNTVGGSDFAAPSSYSPKTNGQLVGLGYAETGTVRTVSARLMLRRGL